MKLSPFMRVGLWAVALLSGAIAAKQLVGSFKVDGATDELHRKDFIQEWFFARAVLAGERLYLPLPEMAKRWLDPVPSAANVWSHPAAHTPVAAALSAPFGLLEYPVAAFVWLMCELLLLAFVWELLFRWWGGAVGWQPRVILYLLSLSLGPVLQELYFGNLSILLLALLLPAWLLLRQGKDIGGGILLGLAIAIKIMGWPIAIFLLFKGRWRAVFSAGAVLTALHLLALAVIGPQQIVEFYRDVGPGMGRGYRQHDGNYSLWSIGPRLFDDYNSVFNCYAAEPLLRARTLAKVLAPGMFVVGLVGALMLAWRCREFDSSFGILLCASLPLNPIAWDHTLLILGLVAAIVLKRLSLLGWPRLETASAAIAFAIMMLSQRAYLTAFAAMFATPNPQGVPIMPFWPGLVTYLPLVAIGIWVWLLVRLDGRVNIPVQRVFSSAS